MGGFDEFFKAISSPSAGKRRGGVRRGSVAKGIMAKDIALALKAQGVDAAAAEELSTPLASAQMESDEQTDETRIGQSIQVVGDVIQLSASTKSLFEGKLEDFLKTLATVWANLQLYGPAAASGVVVGVGAAGAAAWQFDYVKEAAYLFLPIIAEDIKKYAHDNMGVALTSAVLFPICLYIFSILLLKSVMKKTPSPASVEKSAISTFGLELKGEPDAAELKQALAILDAKVAAAEAAMKAQNPVPQWTGANAVPLGMPSQPQLTNAGGRRRSTSRRRRHQSYLPKRTRRSSSGRRQRYSRRRRE